MKVAIFGSCVTRDIFSIDAASQFKVTEYYARSSIASAFGKSGPRDEYSGKLHSPFQRRMVAADISKEFSKLLDGMSFDLLLVDFIDERFHLFQDESRGLVTLSNELVDAGFDIQANRGRVVPSGSKQFILDWKQGWRTFIDALKRSGQIDRLFINKVYWAEETESGAGFFPSYSKTGISAANRFLDNLYEQVALDLPERQILSFPADLFVGADSHKWGPSPFHYVDDYYRHACARIKAATAIAHAGGDAYIPIRYGRRKTLEHSPGTQCGSGLRIESRSMMKRNIELRNLRLSDQPIMDHLDVFSEDSIDIAAELICGLNSTANAALLQFTFDGAAKFDPLDYGLSESTSPRVGFYRYLDTRPGITATSITVNIPPGTTRVSVGVRHWCPKDVIFLSRLLVQARQTRSPRILVSVDVEALPGRAASNHVDRLIFGRFAGARYGIERLCDIFDDFGVNATFFVDYSTCILHGDEGTFRAAELLSSRGHDVQLHMHSEVLVRALKLPHTPGTFPSFEALEVGVMKEVLTYGIEKYQRNLGMRPAIFRPGGMKKSQGMYEACKDLGIKAVSAIFKGFDSGHWSRTNMLGTYEWGNGVREIPLDLALDPLGEWPKFSQTVYEAVALKKQFSVLLHSTSLLYRKRDSHAVFTQYEPEYEATLRRYLDILSDAGEFATHAELLSGTAGTLTTVSLSSAGLP